MRRILEQSEASVYSGLAAPFPPRAGFAHHVGERAPRGVARAQPRGVGIAGLLQGDQLGHQHREDAALDGPERPQVLTEFLQVRLSFEEYDTDGLA